LKRISGVLVLLVGSAALACGGPSSAEVASCLASPESAIHQLVADDEYWDGGRNRPPFRFLDPFVAAGRPWAVAMARRAYEEANFVPEGDAGFEAFLVALRSDDRPAAHRAALHVVDELLSMPAPFATPHAPQLSRAVEYLELEPALPQLERSAVQAWFVDRTGAALPAPLAQARVVSSTPREGLAALLAADPKQLRAPSIELAVLRERMRTEIPDGWPAANTAGPWAALLTAHDAWLARYPKHPLADLARLQKLRVLFLQADSQGAWKLLLDLHARRPARATWELRHLIMSGQGVPVELLALKDPVLATALVTTVDPATWATLWARAQANAKEPWAKILELRLLANSATAGDAVPVEARKTDALWMQLHCAALLNAKKFEAALAQAHLLDPKDRVSTRLWSQAAVQTGHWREAVELDGVDEPARRFLLQVIIPEAELEALARAPGPRRAEAALALAGRRLGDEGWAAGAALLAEPDPKRAAVWTEAARRAGDHTGPGRLAFARWVKNQPLFATTEAWHARGLKARLSTRTPGEEALLTQVLLRTGARERALEAYAQALELLPPKSKEARAALSEADALYNQLLNWDANWAPEYPKWLQASAPAERIRAAGKAIRAK